MILLFLFFSCGEESCLEFDPFGDGLDQNCDGTDGVDRDQDGQASMESGGVDCNDSNAEEQALLYFVDRDGDGFGDPEHLYLQCFDIEIYASYTY